jgi:hypothetical protein
VTRARRIALGAGAGAALVVLGLQLVPVERTNPPVESAIAAPEAVAVLLRRACFDCHSHATRWPWYSRVAPLSWWIADHVAHGREHLNFSRWPDADADARDHALREIEEQVKTEEMPLASYLLVHREAHLTPEEREAIVRWARSAR